MTKTLTNILMGFILILFSSALSANSDKESGYNQYMPLEWQVISLQENIEKKILKSLSPVIDENEFITEVKIQIDRDTIDDPSSKNVTTTKQTKKVQYNDTNIPSDSGTYVLLNKFGLEAPVVGEEPVEIKTSEAELNQKAIIEMNDRFNIFQHLKSITINLTFDKSLPDKTKDIIRKIISGLSFNLETTIPQINLQFLDLKESKIAKIEIDNKNAKSSNLSGDLKQILPHKTGLEKFDNLDLATGIILASIIISLTLLLIKRKDSAASNASGSLGAGNSTESQGANSSSSGASNGSASSGAGGGSGGNNRGKSKNDNSEAENSNSNSGSSAGGPTFAEQTLDKIENEDDMKVDLTRKDPLTVKINESLERFRKCYSNHKGQAILMLKTMIKNAKPMDVLALQSFIQVLEDQELADIFNSLTIEERSAWRLTLGNELTREEIAKGFSYIAQKVMELMMVPSFIDDFEVCDLLLDVTAVDAAKFSKENIEIGIVFINVLSPNIISEMFNQLGEKEVFELISRAETLKKDEVISKIPLLKEKLVEVKEKRQKSPFVMRIFEILPSAGPEIEEKLYLTLLRNFSKDEVLGAAIKTLPSCLSAQIPDNVYKSVIALMPIASQVNYFVSMNDQERESSLDKFAPKGTKSRELLELEMSTILKNEVQTKRIQLDMSYEIQKEYLELLRKYISNNTEAQKEMKSVIEEWLSKMINQSQHGLAA